MIKNNGKMYSDLLKVTDEQLMCIVAMIDLSTTFDTVDLDIMINILQSEFHISMVQL